MCISDLEKELIKRAKLKSEKKRKYNRRINFKSRYLNSVYMPTINDSLSMKILKSKIPLLKNGLITGIQIKGFVVLNNNTLDYIEKSNCKIENDLIKLC